MAPRKKRGSSSSTAYDTDKFVSLDAQNRHNHDVVLHKPIPERGISVAGVDFYQEITETIESRGWTKFCAQPGAAVAPLVREFYANATEHQNQTAYVRGKWVPFHREAINRYYGLPNVADDQYSEYLEHGPDLNAVIRFLASPGTSWRTTREGASSFTKGALNKVSKAWFYFIVARMMPTSHVSDISKDRAVLLFAIQNHISIDVGKVLNESILHCIKSHSSGLFFPTLITELCRLSNVVWTKEEGVVHPAREITFSTIVHYKEEASGASSSQGRPSPQQQPLPHQITKAMTMNERLANLEREHLLHRHEFQEFSQWFVGHAQGQTNWLAQQAHYQAACNNSIEQMVRDLAINMGANVTQFPPLPAYPRPPTFFPPPSMTAARDTGGDEEEEDDDE